MGATSALAAGALAVGLAGPAAAAPVTVSGVLTDPAGNAIDGYVSAYLVAPDGTTSYAKGQYVADGQMSLGLEPGPYKFEFESRYGEWASEFYNDKATLETADAVTVAGPTTLAPVSLAARPLITGQVVAPSGHPVAGGYVRAYDAATGFQEGLAPVRKDGSFRLGVDAGTYKVQIVPGSGFVSEWYNNKATLETADPIAVPATGANAGQVVVTQGGSINGVVTAVAGGALERVRVTARRVGGYNTYTDLTDASGVYHLEDLPVGDYKLQFTDPVGEYLSEWHVDKADEATADVVAVGVETHHQGVNAALAPDPAAVVDETQVDLSGVVVDSAGQPVIGASVDAVTTPLDPDDRYTEESVRTNRKGMYFFTELDPASTQSSEKTYKINVEDTLEREQGQYHRLARWFGDKQSYETATPVTVPAPSKYVTLPLTGGVSGAVTSESGLSVRGVSAMLVSAEDNLAGPADYVYAEHDGSWSTTSLVPGTYKVLFADSGSWNAKRHAPEWYDDATFEDAEVITIKSGQTTSGINAALSADLFATEKPEITGKPYVGGTVKAKPGAWSIVNGTTFAYEWLIDGAVVGTAASLELTSAHYGERVTLRVTAENTDLLGQALVTSQKIQYEPKIKIKAKGSSAAIAVKAAKTKTKKIKGAVVVREVVKVKPNGKVKYKKIGKAKIKAGTARVSLAKVKGKGKHTLVFDFSFKGKMGDAVVTKKIKRKG